MVAFVSGGSNDIFSKGPVETNDDALVLNQWMANELKDSILKYIDAGTRSLTGSPVYPSYYGGSFVEPDGHLTIFVVGDSLSAVSKLKKIAESSVIRYRLANYSYQELCDVSDEIWSRLKNAPKKIAQNVSAYGLNQKCNAVEVYLIDNSSVKINEFKEEIYNHPCLIFSQSGRFSNESISINPCNKVCKTISTVDKFGSMAFRVKQTRGGKRLGFVTAGHVLNVGASAYIDSIKVGECVKSIYDGGANADAAFVAIDNNLLDDYSLGNYVNDMRLNPLSTITIQPGEGICVNKIGASTGVTGGYIKNTSLNIVDNAGVTVLCDLVSATYASAKGDSGGLVYAFVKSSNTRYTVGVHKGFISGDNLSIYSKADNVLSALDVQRY